MNVKAFRHQVLAQFSVILTTCLLWSGLDSARAEGSKELTSNGGNRAYLTYSNNRVYFGVAERTRLYVYVDAGETINLGSSANGLNNGQIQYKNPSGSTGTCPISSTIGRIVDRTQELIGPFPTSGGYTPCTITAAFNESGIWQIDFISPNPNNQNVPGVTYPGSPPSISAAANWSPQGLADWFVTAWDITITQGTSNVRTGRVYANYVAMNIGANLNNAFNGIFYVVTRDGYHYRVKANGLDPYRFIFFSDNKGVYNTTTNNPTYRSFDLNLPSGVAFRDPNTTETTTEYTNKLFFNPIDPALPATISAGFTSWLNPSLAPPPPPTNISLVGAEGTANQMGQNLGGTFNFNNPDTIPRPYQITLDLNGNNVFGDGNDRILSGTAAAGANSVAWDGKDGSGAIVKSQTTSFKSVVATLGGEVHFPLIDAESNTAGLIIQRLNGQTVGTITSPSFNPDRIYYNDSLMKGNGGAGGSAAIPPNPLDASTGIDSSSGAHRWGMSNDYGFGNASILDTWAYAPEFTPNTLNITIKAADLDITKSLVGSLTKGQTATYNLDVTNANDPAIGSVSNVVGATVTDLLPTVFSNPKVISCQVISGMGNCGTYGFTGNTFDAKVDLNSGSKLRFEIQATLAASAAGSITNSATIFRPKDIGDPVDRDGLGGTTNLSETATVSGTVGVKSGKAKLLLVKRITAINGDRTKNPHDGTPLDGIVHDATTTNDTHPHWPHPNYLVGAIQAGKIESNDTIEYTIYFLSSEPLDAGNVRICDRLSDGQSFQAGAYAGQDLQAQIGIAPIFPLTAANDAIDRAVVYPPNTTVPADCQIKAANTSGTVDFSLTGSSSTGMPNLRVVPGSSAAGMPTNSYGFVRFTTKIN